MIQLGASTRIEGGIIVDETRILCQNLNDLLVDQFLGS